MPRALERHRGAHFATVSERSVQPPSSGGCFCTRAAVAAFAAFADAFALPRCRTSTSAQTAAIVNGGTGAGTLVTLPASKVNFAVATFDGTNWLFDMCGTQ